MDARDAHSHALVAAAIGLLLMVFAGIGASLDPELGTMDVVAAIALGFLAGALVSEIQHER